MRSARNAALQPPSVKLNIPFVGSETRAPESST